MRAKFGALIINIQIMTTERNPDGISDKFKRVEICNSENYGHKYNPSKTEAL